MNEKVEEGINWLELVKSVIKDTTKMSPEEYAKFQSFAPDYSVSERQKDQWFLRIGENRYRVGYIFLRDLFLVYDESGKMVVEARPKKEK